MRQDDDPKDLHTVGERALSHHAHDPRQRKGGILRLTSKVAANKHSVKHGFTTFSLPLPVVLG
jgi:hypothetical protein